MSQLFVDNIKGRTGGAIGAPSGAVVTGVLTATSGSFTGNVSIGGTLTYEDVTNVDAVGIITAQSGVNVTGGSVVVGSAVTVNSSGINVVGIITATQFKGDGSGLSGVESWNQFDTWLYGGVVNLLNKKESHGTGKGKT